MRALLGTRRVDGMARRSERFGEVGAGDLLDRNIEGATARREAAGELQRGRRRLGDAIRLDREHDRQVPERGNIHRLVDEALAEGAVAEPGAGYGAAAPGLLRQRDADGVADTAALHAVGIEIAPVQVLAAAPPAADAVGPAEDLGEKRKDLAAIGEEMPVAAMVAEHAVARAVERSRDRDCGDLLADAGVGRAADAAGGELVEQHALEDADAGREMVVIGGRRRAIRDREAHALVCRRHQA